MRRLHVRRPKKSLKSLSTIYPPYKNRCLYEEKNPKKVTSQRSPQTTAEEIRLAAACSAVHGSIIDHQVDGIGQSSNECNRCSRRPVQVK